MASASITALKGMSVRSACRLISSASGLKYRRALRDEINLRIREHLIAEGAVSGPARQGEKLVSGGDGPGLELRGWRHGGLHPPVS